MVEGIYGYGDKMVDKYELKYELMVKKRTIARVMAMTEVTRIRLAFTLSSSPETRERIDTVLRLCHAMLEDYDLLIDRLLWEDRLIWGYENE